MKKLAVVCLLAVLPVLFASAQGQGQGRGAGGFPAPVPFPDSGSLKQVIPGHYVYSAIDTTGRSFNSGIVVTSEGALVFDAMGSVAIGHAQREAISSTIKQPVRYLVSSSFHDQFSKGAVAYPDVIKIVHENHRTGLVEQMQRDKLSAEEQRARMPTATYRDRMTVHLGGKEIQILYLGRAHTDGDSIVFVPQDRIAYLGEVFFFDEFPTLAGGDPESWIQVIDKVDALNADILVPGHGPIPDDPKVTKAGLRRMRQVYVDAREAVQNEIGRGATEDQVVAAVKLPQYEKLINYTRERENLVRRLYRASAGNRR